MIFLDTRVTQHQTSRFRHLRLKRHIPFPKSNINRRSWNRRVLSAAATWSLPHQVTRGCMKAFAKAAAVTGLVVAALPTLVSTDVGTKVTSMTLSKLLPGVVDIAHIRVGWQQPLHIQGLKVFDGHETTGSRTLLAVDSIKSTANLLQFVSGQPLDVVVHRPVIDMTYSPSAEELRVMSFLRQAGIIEQESSTTAVQAAAEPESSQQQSSSTTDDGSCGEPRSQWLQRMCTEGPPVSLTADVRLQQITIYVSDGILKAPQDAKEVLGPHVHATVVRGLRAFADSADELGLDTSWVTSPLSPSTLPSPMHLDPATLQVHSSHMEAHMDGWVGKGAMWLRQPANVCLDYHPAMIRYGLSQVNPFLSDVVSIEDKGKLLASFKPDALKLPYTTAIAEIQPLKLKVSKGAAITQLCGVLDIGRGELGSVMELWTSPMQCKLEEQGRKLARITTERVDMLVVGGKQRLHVALWGSCNAQTNELDMTLGLPADTLSSLGFSTPSPDFMLTVQVAGTSQSMSVNWREAAKKLAFLSATRWWAAPPTTASTARVPAGQEMIARERATPSVETQVVDSSALQQGSTASVGGIDDHSSRQGDQTSTEQITIGAVGDRGEPEAAGGSTGEQSHSGTGWGSRLTRWLKPGAKVAGMVVAAGMEAGGYLDLIREELIKESAAAPGPIGPLPWDNSTSK